MFKTDSRSTYLGTFNFMVRIRILVVSAIAVWGACQSHAQTNPAVADAVRLTPGDRLVYYVKEDPRSTGPEKIIVSSLGELRFSVSRDSGVDIVLKVQDKTIEQIRAELKKKLDSDYYVNATVLLELDEKSTRQGQVYFDGAVQRKTLALDPGKKTTLYEALLQVGYTEWAKLSNVKVVRINQATGKLETHTINVDDAKKNPKKDFELQDGDRVTVDEKLFNFK